MIVSDTPLAQTHPAAQAHPAQPHPGAALRRIAARRRMALAASAAAGLALGYLGYLSAPLLYNSEVVLVLDARKIQVLPTESVVSPLPQDSPVLRSELDIIASHIMAERVMERLPPETVAALRAGGTVSPLSRLAHEALALVTGAMPPAAQLLPTQPLPTRPLPTPAAADRGDPALEAALLSRLRVVNDGRSYTIFISSTAGDPQTAANVANAFAEAYLDYQVDIKGAGTRQASDWLGDKLGNLRASLENSERALSEFRIRSNLIGVTGDATQVQRVTASESELISARAALSGARARLATAEAQLRSDGELAIAEANGVPLIQALKAEQFRVERRIQELIDDGATLSAELPNLRSQLAAIRQQTDLATRRVVESLTAEVEIAALREKNSAGALAEARQRLEEANKARVQEAQLEREAAANRAIYESYLARYKQTIELDGIAGPDARIISRATASGRPASPRLPNWLLLGLALGVMAGMAYALLRELMARPSGPAEADVRGRIYEFPEKMQSL